MSDWLEESARRSVAQDCGDGRHDIDPETDICRRCHKRWGDVHRLHGDEVFQLGIHPAPEPPIRGQMQVIFVDDRLSPNPVRPYDSGKVE